MEVNQGWQLINPKTDLSTGTSRKRPSIAQNTSKRKQSGSIETPAAKRPHHTKALNPGYTTNGNPIGLIWDSSNYSCPYDVMFSVLFNIWTDNTDHWSNYTLGAVAAKSVR